MLCSLLAQHGSTIRIPPKRMLIPLQILCSLDPLQSLDISATPEGTLVFTRKNGDGSKVSSETVLVYRGGIGGGMDWTECRAWGKM